MSYMKNGSPASSKQAGIVLGFLLGMCYGTVFKQCAYKAIGYLRLVAATIHERGLIGKTDARLSLDRSKGGIISQGKRVAARVLNGLGFINSRLYMSQIFFHHKPIAALLGEEILIEHLNDDCMGNTIPYFDKNPLI